MTLTNTTPPAPTQIDRAIYVDYSPTFVRQGTKGLYLVCYVKITNIGYNDFISSPSEFHVYVKGNLYNYDPSLSDLATLDMKPNSKILGLLAFAVPDDIETAGWAWWHAQQNDNYDFVYREQARQSVTNG